MFHDMPRTAPSDRILSARLELSTTDHQRFVRLAERHERSLAQECRWAIKHWLDQHDTAQDQQEAGHDR
jgi:hypothetical protein